MPLLTTVRSIFTLHMGRRGHLRPCSRSTHNRRFGIRVEKLAGKTLLGRFGRKWDDNIKMYLKICCEESGLQPSGSEEVPVGNSCEHGNEPSDFIKMAEFLA
jgi:hypothetical protein